MPYLTNEQTEPFWAEYSNARNGRDPLAIQNSSVVIYTKMVVGLTNVTNRIRYYGFYCWLIDSVNQNISANTLSEQIRYIRRAELLLAYIMVEHYKNVRGVSGSDYPARNPGSVINLIEGADWESKKDGGKVYWQLYEGIFGQYFSAVLRDVDLVNHPSPQLDLSIYTLTENGMKLARAFEKNVSQPQRKLFWELITQGTLKRNALSDIQDFKLHEIPFQSSEHSFYENLLLSADDRRSLDFFNRRDTIQLILQYLNANPSGVEEIVNSFLKTMYSSSLNHKKFTTQAEIGWFLFEINELLHVSLEFFHATFLYSLKDYPTLFENHIALLVRETVDAFNNDSGKTRAKTLADLIDKLELNRLPAHEYYDNAWNEYDADLSNGNCLKEAVYCILSVFIDCQNHMELLNSFASDPRNNFNRNGYAISIFNDLINEKLELNLEDYIREVLLYAINLHTHSSYSKTRIGQGLVHNYIIEEKYVWRLREVGPSRTTPRLGNLIQYLVDIKWVRFEDATHFITSEGQTVLKSL